MTTPASSHLTRLDAGKLVVRAVRRLGSLQLAVVALGTFAAVLIIGTLVESRHGRPVAADLVYRTWWFVALLGLLAVSVFFAAAKKWPWKRHQTGFLITHVGLLTLISGGVIDSLFGVTGAMELATTSASRSDSAPNRGGTLHDRSSYRIRVRQPGRNPSTILDESFLPGPLSWDCDGGPTAPVDVITNLLGMLRDPLAGSWERSLGDNGRIEIRAFHPHARTEPYGVADEAGSGPPIPAIRLQMGSPALGLMAPRWLGLDPAGSSLRLGPGRIEFVAQHLSPGQVEAFCNPGGDSVPRLDDSSLRGLLQFVTSEDGRLFFRSFSGGKPPGVGVVLESSGEVAADPDQWNRIWPAMDWRFRVLEFLPRARPGLYCTPVDRPSAGEDRSTPAVIRCRLTCKNNVREFWLERTDDSWVNGVVGGERFEVGFHATRHDLNFQISLVRAEQTVDPVSGKPTGLASFILLNDAQRGIADRPHLVSLNQPLAHRGYRVYQGGIKSLPSDEFGRPQAQVQFLANRDPGMWLKYAGSAMVALGIACMFWMRAYFFKRPEAPKS